MANLSQLSDTIGSSSSSKEVSERPTPQSEKIASCCAAVVDHAVLERERIARTSDVKERIGPLIEKLKKSVTKIQALEKPIRSSADDDTSDVEMNKKDEGTKLRNTSIQGQSRRFMDQSMAMVKKKMLRLKVMEEELARSEDRRVNLHHHLQQIALQASEVKSVTSIRDTECQKRNRELEKDISFMSEKSSTAEDLREESASLLEKTKYYQELENELERERSLRQMSELRLQEYEHKIKQQAIEYDNLQCRFDVLTSTLTNLTSVLQSHGKSNLNLEQDIMENMSLQKQCFPNHENLLQTIGDVVSNDSGALTVPSNVSWSESSISNETSFDGNDHSNATIFVSRYENLTHENTELT